MSNKRGGKSPTQGDISRIQSAEARRNQGKVDKGGQAARMQRAFSRQQNQDGSRNNRKR